MWRVGLLLSVIGCGRIAFDEVAPDADAPGDGATVACASPAGHDDDGDGLDDACDPCPLRAGDAADADGDRVGDACDPTALPTARLVLFDPFVSRRPEWDFDTQEQFIPDQLRLAAIGTAISARQRQAPGRETFEVRGHVDAVGTGDHAVSLQIGELTGSRYYFCDLVYLQGELLLSFVYTVDRVTYTPIQFLPVGTILDGNDIRLTLAHEPPTVTCTATVGSASMTVGGAIPVNMPAEAMYVAASNLDVNLDGFTRVASALTARPAPP